MRLANDKEVTVSSYRLIKYKSYEKYFTLTD